jgi:4'-phosphopantetheinyl transferase
MARRDDGWVPAGDSPGLRPGAVHVWCVSLDDDRDLLPRAASVLTPGEVARADRFRFDPGRERYTLARGLLRTVLASELRVAPREVALRIGDHDKPELDEVHARPDMHFNVSHSGRYALVAFACGVPVGVDVEVVRADRPRPRFAERFFATQEVDELYALPPAERPAAFARIWTRKEAYVKALGTGLTRPLQAFAVSHAVGESGALRWVDGAPGEAARWTLGDLAVADGYAGAVAVPVTPVDVHRWRWSPR